MATNMKPEYYQNGHGSAGDDDSDDGDEPAIEEELSLLDDGYPARALASLDALRKSRQHYDLLLLAADGAELPAHSAVLAAASPYLLRALPAPAPAHSPSTLRVPVDAESLRALLDYAYSGRLRVRDAEQARRLYVAAWRLRLESARVQLAERLLRRPTPATCLQLRALPDLPEPQRATLDAYVALHFEEVCEGGALGALPAVCVEVLKDGGAPEEASGKGDDAPGTLAEATLAWLLEQYPDDAALEEASARGHLLYSDIDGALRDCGRLPVAPGDAPRLREYRREAANRIPRPRQLTSTRSRTEEQLGERAAREPASAVLGARRVAGGVRALLLVRGRALAVHVAAAEGGPDVVRDEEGAGNGKGEARAHLASARCAHGTAALDGRLVVCGGYDRTRALRSAEAYDPVTNTWSALRDMPGARARFPAAVVRGALVAVGGSDGTMELDSVTALGADGRWAGRARLPVARSHAAAAVDEEGRLFVVGGWAGGRPLRRVHVYWPERASWSEAPALAVGRSQCAAVAWGGALWVLGGCDAWRCLSTTETMPLAAAIEAPSSDLNSTDVPNLWTPGPALPTARRSMGGCVWRGTLVVCGGSDGSASLSRTDLLASGATAWRAGPPLRRARAALGLAVLQDALYAVGGYSGKEFLACVECLYSPDGAWTTLCTPPALTSPALRPREAEDLNGDHACPL